MQMQTGVKLQISFTIIVLMCLTFLSKQRLFGSRHASYDALVVGQEWIDTGPLHQSTGFVLHLHSDWNAKLHSA